MKGCANLQPNNIDNIGNISNIDNMSNLFTRQELIDIARGQHQEAIAEETTPEGKKQYYAPLNCGARLYVSKDTADKMRQDVQDMRQRK